MKLEAGNGDGKEAIREELELRAMAGTLRLDAVLALSPAAASPADFEFLGALSPAQRQQALRRLLALIRNEEGMPVGLASRLADVSGPNFYRLRQRWRDRAKHGLGFLSGYAGRPTRQPRGTRAADFLEKLSADFSQWELAERSIRGLSKVIQDERSARIPTYTLDAAARQLRQNARNSLDVLDARYGARLLVDYCAVSLVACSPDGSAKLVEIAWVIEENTQLILAARPVLDVGGCVGQQRALRAARWYLGRCGLDVEGAAGARVEAVVPDPISPLDRQHVDRVVSVAGEEHVATAGVRRFGRLVTDVVGPILGRIKIIPRSTLSEDTSAAHVRAFGRDALDHRSVRVRVAQSVIAHNRPIIEMLRGSRLPLIEAGDRKGAMTSTLDALLLRRG